MYGYDDNFYYISNPDNGEKYPLEKEIFEYNFELMGSRVVYYEGEVLIGCGNVGMAYAYSLMNQRTPVTELALIDLNTERVSGEVLDLNHCNQFADSKMKVKVGSYEDCKDAKIVVIAAGANQNVGETRMDLINKNSQVFKSIIDKVMENNFNGIIIVATNPLDVMTYITLKYSNLSPTKVIGTGTI